MLYFYKLLSFFFLPLAPIFLKYRSLTNKEDPIRYKEKLSIINLKRDEGLLIWFHASSVGEVQSILPIIENLINSEKVTKILVTTVTLSSSKVFLNKMGNQKKIIHQFFPLDIPIIINKFLDNWKPNLSIFVESEIWPNTILNIKKRNIPIILLNARITLKTFNRWNFFKNASKNIFNCFDLCLSQNSETSNYLKKLGAKNIKNFGNIKFCNLKDKPENTFDERLTINTKNKIMWCASSTHEKEEIFCAKVHLELKKRFNNILVIIIPRHVDRIEKIYNEIKKLNLKVKVVNQLTNTNENLDIILVNTYGETNKYFQLSNSVFLGGSIIPHGGQNPLEPSRNNCMIYHGPYINNFKEIYEHLKSLGCAKEIEKENFLKDCLTQDLEKQKNDMIEYSSKIIAFGDKISNEILSEIKRYF